MKSSSIIWAVLLLLIVLGGGWYWYSTNMPQAPAGAVSSDTTSTGGNTTPPADTQSTGVNVGASADVSTAPMSATITYDGAKFTPNLVTIAKGGTVTFVDNSSSAMWVASGVHPDHTVYDGTTRATHCAAGYAGPAPFDQCAAGNSFTFTFDKTGTWPFHNHLNSSASGKVTVQ